MNFWRETEKLCFLLATWILPETQENGCKIHSLFYSSHFKNCDIFTCCRLYWTANSLRRHVKNFKANLKRQRPCNAEKFNMKTIVVVRGCFGRRVFALLFLKHSNSDEVICSVMNPEKVKYRGFQLKMPCFEIGYTFWP